MTESKHSLIDLSGASEPINKLIDAIGSACGALYEPVRIRRRAKAEADALVVRKQAEIAVDSLASRASARLAQKEIRRQKNIEDIVSQAAKELPDQVDSAPVGEDWIAHFFESCQDIGEDDLKKIWAKILAGEVAKPKSFSLRTLSLVRLLTSEEAKRFVEFCSFLWSYNEDRFLIQTASVDHFLREKRGFSYPTVLHLRSIGLIEPGDNIIFQLVKNEKYDLCYGGKTFRLHFFGETVRRLTISPLTSAGRELSALLPPKCDEGYRDVVLVDLFRQSYYVNGMATMRGLRL